MFILFTLVLAAAAHALHAALDQPQVLVVFDPELSSPDNADIFRLENHEVSFVDYSDDAAQLFLGEDPIYDHVVFLPLLKKAAAAKSIVDKHKLLEFFNKGGNVLAVQNEKSIVPEEVRLFLNEAGIYPAPKGFELKDYFGPIAVSDENNLAPRVLGNVNIDNYVGSAALASNNPYVIPLVRGSKTSFTASSKDSAVSKDKTWTFGNQGFLGLAAQGLNSARVAWLGSEQLLLENLIQWVFQQKGVLKLQFVQHYKAEEPGIANRTLYRVKNDVVYTAGISEWKDGQWTPYVPQAEDDTVQVAFRMLDPYIRVNMTLLGPGASEENGPDDLSIFYANFTTPDHHGMFTFDLDYKRPGLSFLSDKRVVTVRHLANDEYKRLWEITNAWLYVVSASAVVGAWFFFVANFLFLGAK